MILDETIKKLLHKARIHKYVIISCLICGLASHSYILANKIIVGDENISLFTVGSTYPSGRWGLAWTSLGVQKLYGGIYSIPLMNVGISLIFLTVAAILTINLLGIKSKSISILIGGLMVCFPVVGSTFTYLFTAPYYFLANLLAVSSVYMIVDKKIWKLCMAIFITSLSCGIYQAYLSVIITLIVMHALCICINDTSDFKVFVYFVIRALVTLLAGIILYFLINKLCLHWRHIEMVSHRGLDRMGMISPSSIITGIKAAFKTFFLLTMNNILGLNGPLLLKINTGICYATTLTVSIYFMKHSAPSNISKYDTNRHLMIKCLLNSWKRIFFVLLSISFPLAVNSIYLMVEPDNVYSLMTYSMVFIYILPLVYVDKVLIPKQQLKLNFHKITSLVLALTTSLTILCFISVNNELYLKLDLLQRQANSYFTTLITRIKSADGYTDQLPIAYISNTILDKHQWDMEYLFNNIHGLGGSRDINNVLNYAWSSYIEKQCGFAPNLEKEQLEMLSCLPQVIAMPSYPDDGSISVIEGIVVVKLDTDSHIGGHQ